MDGRRHRIGIWGILFIAAFGVYAPKWLRYPVDVLVVAFLLLVVVTEIVVRYRKSRPIPSMKNPSPEDAKAVIGSTPIFLDRRDRERPIDRSLPE